MKKRITFTASKFTMDEIARTIIEQHEEISASAQLAEQKAWEDGDIRLASYYADFNIALDNALRAYNEATAQKQDTEYCLWAYTQKLLDYLQENEGVKDSFGGVRYEFSYVFGYYDRVPSWLTRLTRDYGAFITA